MPPNYAEDVFQTYKQRADIESALEELGYRAQPIVGNTDEQILYNPKNMHVLLYVNWIAGVVAYFVQAREDRIG